MGRILKYTSYIFHPLFMPFFGVAIYYCYSSKFYETTYIQNRLLQLFILTVIIPLLLFRVLKKLKLVSSIMAESVNERKFPYAIGTLLNLYISQFVFKSSTEPELHYFFIGITYTSLALLILSLIKYKASLHMAGISGLTMFAFALSIHFQTDMIIIIGFLFLLNGLIASSRLFLKAHTYTELIIGSIMGLLPQFTMMIYWL